MYNFTSVRFSDVPLNGWFKSDRDGVFHLKISENNAAYSAWGIRHELAFAPLDDVLVEILKDPIQIRSA